MTEQPNTGTPLSLPKHLLATSRGIAALVDQYMTMRGALTLTPLEVSMFKAEITVRQYLATDPVEAVIEAMERK